MTLAQLIAQLEEQISSKLAQRNEHAKELAKLRDATDANANAAVDEAKVSELRKAKADLDTEIDALNNKLRERKEELARDEAMDRLSRDIRPTADRPPARTGQEPRTYSTDNDKRGKGFLMDVVRQFLYADRDAVDRLSRHMQEERVERGEQLERATGTGAFAGLTVPQYLTDMYAPKTAALRPFADICNKHDLPSSGMTVNISRITTASSVALQSSENAAVSETDMDDTLLTLNVLTAAGQQTISRQGIDRGTGIEDVTLDDLYRRYSTNIDSTLITQATTGLSAVAQATAYTDATPTAAELWPKILNATANSEAVLLGQAQPDYAVMHSRRWYWLQSQVGTSWPFMSQPGIATQAGGTANESGYNEGVRGMLPSGLRVIVDNNIATDLGAGTNEDEIYVVPSAECHLWEDSSAPVFIRAEQTKAANLGVLLVVYGYFAYTFSRYSNGTSKIGGTGLVTPTF